MSRVIICARSHELARKWMCLNVFDMKTISNENKRVVKVPLDMALNATSEKPCHETAEEEVIPVVVDG